MSSSAFVSLEESIQRNTQLLERLLRQYFTAPAVKIAPEKPAPKAVTKATPPALKDTAQRVRRRYHHRKQATVRKSDKNQPTQSFCCRRCSSTFASNNQLHRHIRSLRHFDRVAHSRTPLATPPPIKPALLQQIPPLSLPPTPPSTPPQYSISSVSSTSPRPPATPAATPPPEKPALLQPNIYSNPLNPICFKPPPTPPLESQNPFHPYLNEDDVPYWERASYGLY